MIRFFDIFLSLVSLLCLAPLLILVALVLRWSGEGEIFYKQKRVGFKNNQFDLLKFATMLKDSPNIGTKTITLKNDPRVLPIGKFLRMTKVNELPQLINILRGDMSIIGPRPLTLETFRMYSLEVQSEIIKCRPGLSGVGSIVFRDEQSLLNQDEENISYRSGSCSSEKSNKRMIKSNKALIKKHREMSKNRLLGRDEDSEELKNESTEENHQVIANMEPIRNEDASVIFSKLEKEQG